VSVASWRVDPGWTGDWTLPPELERPLGPDDRRALVTLSCGGMGPGRLVEALADVRRVRDALAGYPLPDYAQRVLARFDVCGARAVTPGDDEYPSDLRHIAAPPPLLYVRGERLDVLGPFASIVGARVCTRGGARFARRIAAALASSGFTVVSGLARGIDAAAHTGALETGRSLAVLGTGIDRVYPSEHDELAEAIEATGALVSEFPPGVGPRQWHFPARNRIVSGLSVGVVVVEAGARSGALITAGFALDQGKDVVACATGPENPAGDGIRAMLHDGARLGFDADQIAADLVELARDQGLTVVTAGERRRDAVASLHGERARVYAVLLDGASTDEIAAATGLRAEAVSSVLAELELDGLVGAEGSRWYRSG
jgi:DNA processing protein